MIEVDVLEFGILVVECFCMLKINFNAGLCADDSTASSQPMCY
jgi:hypothetical protein